MSTPTFHSWLSVGCIALAGCLYNSDIGAQKRAQQHNAEHLAPSTIAASSPSTASIGTRALRLRVLATPEYCAQSMDWQQTVRETIDDANALLGPEIGVRLEVVTMLRWEGASGQEDLPATLDALHARDDGEGVDDVVGFVGSFPHVTRSFHLLGLAESLGKHFVVRASSNLDELAAIDAHFDKLSEEARSELRTKLRRHRQTALFLHELAHTLGAIHETTADNLMFHEYRSSMRAFAPATTELLRLSAEARTSPSSKGDGDRDLARAILVLLDRNADAPWVAAERDELAARLRAKADSKVASITPVHKLPWRDQASLESANAALEAGDTERAHRIAMPLCESYPDELAVQDLRCRIATRAGVDYRVIQHECARFMELSMPQTAK